MDTEAEKDTILEVEKQQLQCLWDDCGKQHESQAELVMHINAQHMIKPFECKWHACLKRDEAQSKANLIMHMRKHTGERPYQCFINDCNRVFTRQDALSKHLKNLHNVSTIALNVPGAKVEVVKNKRKHSELNQSSDNVIDIDEEEVKAALKQSVSMEQLQQFANALRPSLAELVSQLDLDVTVSSSDNGEQTIDEAQRIKLLEAQNAELNRILQLYEGAIKKYRSENRQYLNQICQIDGLNEE